jgi:hypothetical protein
MAAAPGDTINKRLFICMCAIKPLVKSDATVSSILLLLLLLSTPEFTAVPAAAEAANACTQDTQRKG